MFFSYEGRVASSDDSESIRLSKENLLGVNFPWISTTNEPLKKLKGMYIRSLGVTYISAFLTDYMKTLKTALLRNGGPFSDDEPLSPCISSYASSLSNSKPFSYTPDNLSDHFDAATGELWPVAYSLRMTIGDKRQIMDRCSLNVNIISFAMRFLSYLNDQVFSWNDLLNVGTFCANFIVK